MNDDDPGPGRRVCVRCRQPVLGTTGLDDGDVCDGCLTIDEQEMLFLAGDATPPPEIDTPGP